MSGKTSWLVLCAVATLLFAFGCKKAAPTTEPASPSPAPTRPKIVYIPKNTGNPYFDSVIDGARQGAADTGCDFVTVAPDTADATSQLPLIKDQIQQGVSAILISPNSPDALNPVLEEAMAKGIRVVTVDSDLTNNESFRDASVQTADPQAVGEGLVELLGSMTTYKGEIAILSATTDAPNQNRWIEAMKKSLAENVKYKDLKLVEVVYGNDEPQKSLTEAESLLAKYPNLKGIIAPTTVGVAAAAQAVETAKAADRIVVTGLGTPNQMRRFVKNGTVKAFALWSPRDEGYLAAQVAAQLAKGTFKSTPGTSFIAGSLGTREVTQKKVVVTGPLTIFTADNIDQFKF